MRTLLLLLSLSSYALEIDDKLTLRILRTSTSGKTILINRGIEDGLKKGEHAKFYTSEGVVARGLVVKVTPTRSTWSLYRLVNANEVKRDNALKLKITRELKVTKDETRSLVEDDLPTAEDPRDLGIPLAENALDEAEQDSMAGPIAQLRGQPMISLLDGKFDIGLSGQFSSLSGNTIRGQADFDGSDSQTNLNFFVEYYFHDMSSFAKQFSIKGLFGFNSSSALGYQGQSVESSIVEFGGGLNYHFGDTRKIGILTPYLGADFMVGSVTSKITSGDGQAPVDSTVSGAGIALRVSGGAKILTSSSIGINIGVGFLTRSFAFEQDDSGSKFEKSVTGFEGLVGVTYRL